MSTVSRIVDIPPPRRGRRELAEDTGLRLGLHIKSAEQAMMAAKTEALRSFGLTVAQYADECAKEMGGKIAITGFVRFALGE